MSEVYVVGHKNPEADSICSAIAYAHLKNETSDDVHVAACLGGPTPDVAFILDHFGIEPPVLIPHVRMRVRDVMTSDLITAGPDASLRSIGELMRAHAIRAVPIVADSRLVGAVSERDLANRYLEEQRIQDFVDRSVSLSQIAETINADIVLGAAETTVSGRVLIGAMRSETMAGYIDPGDVVVVGNRPTAQDQALRAGISCLIVTGGFTPDAAQLETAEANDIAVLVTPHDTYAAARLINLSVPAADVMATDIVTAGPDDLLSEVIEDVLGSPHREVIAVDENNRPVGIVTRTNLVRPPKRRVILVDHNERSQAADGIDEATVLEIIDHHRIGDIQTADPILVINEPLGATATIVAGRYLELGVDIPPAIAGVLMSAIVSDTVLLKSPTATEVDRETVEKLAAICGEDWSEFGARIFAQRTPHATVSPADILAQDLKTYHFGEAKVAISQVETVNAAALLDTKPALLAEMARLAADRECDTVVLMITDIVREGTEILVAGKARLVERAFDVKLVEGSTFLPDVISRKKQVAARLAESARVAGA
jgi:manganese-dependent inorganic pyrophosphatase